MSDPASPLPASNSSVSPPNSELGTSNTSGHPSPPKKSKTPGPRHQAVLDTQCPKKCSERLFKAIMASLVSLLGLDSSSSEASSGRLDPRRPNSSRLGLVAGELRSQEGV